MDRIRTLIVDDHPVFAKGVKTLLEDESDIEVIGYALDGFSALQQMEESPPDVVVLDARLPSLSGPELARQIKARWPRTEILTLSGFDEDDIVCDMISAGATGYVLKESDPGEIARAIRIVAAGQSHLTPSVARKVLERMSQMGDTDRSRVGEAEGLSARELEVLQMIAQGATNKEIARKLYLSDRTVENHVYNIYRKLQVHDRTQAMLYAVRKGLVAIDLADSA